MRLRSLHESRVFPIPPGIAAQFERVSKTIDNKVRDSINIGGRRILITYDLTHDSKGTHRFNDEEDVNEIVLGPHEGPEDIYDTLVHEYVHNIDPSAGHYGPIGKDGGLDYWAHPEEFNAYSNQIVHKIIRRLAELRSRGPDAAAIFLDRIYSALRYPKEFGDWSGFGKNILDWWTDNPELWKRFKTRLYNAIQDELKINRSEYDTAGEDFASEYLQDFDA